MALIPRIRLGQQSDGTYGLRVSEAGYDVTTNPIDNERLLFNSDWAMTFPIWYQFSVSISASMGAAAQVFFPDCGFIPWASFTTTLSGVQAPMRNTTTNYAVVNRDNVIYYNPGSGGYPYTLRGTIYNVKAFDP